MALLAFLRLVIFRYLGFTASFLVLLVLLRKILGGLILGDFLIQNVLVLKLLFLVVKNAVTH
jgi:hypothetical protein